MEWTKHSIWWHLYPLGFTGAPVHGWDGESQANLHRLNRIEKWLDYALELGASGIALGPIFESEKHGYDTVDYYHVDGRLGTDEDIDGWEEKLRPLVGSPPVVSAQMVVGRHAGSAASVSPVVTATVVGDEPSPAVPAVTVAGVVSAGGDDSDGHACRVELEHVVP